MNKKIILAKNKDKALFLFAQFGFEYVVGTLVCGNEDKQVGESVSEWTRSAYFGKDLAGALQSLNRED